MAVKEKQKEWIPACAGMTKKEKQKFVSFVFCCFFAFTDYLQLITDNFFHLSVAPFLLQLHWRQGANDEQQGT